MSNLELGIYSKEAFADLVGVPVSMVRFWIMNGAVSSVKLGNVRFVRFPGVAL